jgi:hypothetical protein
MCKYKRQSNNKSLNAEHKFRCPWSYRGPILSWFQHVSSTIQAWFQHNPAWFYIIHFDSMQFCVILTWFCTTLTWFYTTPTWFCTTLTSFFTILNCSISILRDFHLILNDPELLYFDSPQFCEILRDSKIQKFFSLLIHSSWNRCRIMILWKCARIKWESFRIANNQVGVSQNQVRVTQNQVRVV